MSAAFQFAECDFTALLRGKVTNSGGNIEYGASSFFNRSPFFIVLHIFI
jgi:hypothetical protein